MLSLKTRVLFCLAPALLAGAALFSALAAGQDPPAAAGADAPALAPKSAEPSPEASAKGEGSPSGPRAPFFPADAAEGPATDPAEELPPQDPIPADSPEDEEIPPAEPEEASKTPEEVIVRLREIDAKQAAWKSLTAAYELSIHPLGRKRPVRETGDVKMRFAPGKPPEERWEGTAEGAGGAEVAEKAAGKVLRIVRDGTVRVWRDGKPEGSFGASDPGRIGPAFLRFPRLPEGWDVLFVVVPTDEPYRRGADPAPVSLALWPAEETKPSPRLRVVYLELDLATGVAYRLSWSETDGMRGTLALYDEKPDAPVTDADFLASEAAADGGLKNGQSKADDQ